MKLLLRIPIALVLSITATSSPIFAQEDGADVLVLSPSSPWNLDFAEHSCALRRLYSDGESTVFFEMRQFVPGDSFRFMAYSDELGEELDGLEYRIHPDDGVTTPSNAYSITVDGDGEGVTFTGPLYRTGALAVSEVGETEPSGESEGSEQTPLTDEEIAAREAAITSISLEQAFERDIRLEIGSLIGPMEVMRTCLDDLLTSWGVDAQVHRTLSRSVTPVGQRRWTRRIIEDYPSRALQRGEQAALNIRLIVNGQGRVEECISQFGIGDPEFEATACRSLSRYARFEPALDADGNPVTSFWTTNIYYSLS